MNTNNLLVILYLVFLTVHVAHVFEEIWGRFWLMNKVFGLGGYLIGNWILFCIPVSLLIFSIQGNIWALYLNAIYIGFMILQGIGHNIATLITKRYFDGFAGGYTGIGLVIIGTPLLYLLIKSI
jgi:hypothetical protein